MGTGICEHGWLPFAGGDHFLHHEPWFLIPLCLALHHHGVACSLLFWCVRVSPACPQGTGWLPRGWPAPACLRQEACMTRLSLAL